LLKLHLILINITGITIFENDLIIQPKNSVNMYSMLRNTIPIASFDINGADAVKPVQVAAVSAKQFQSVYSISPVAITTVHCPEIFCCCLPFPNETH